MLAIFLKTLQFFAIIGLGYGAARTRFVSAQAAASLTQFVFYFALSAMLFRFAAQLSLAELFDWRFVAAYLLGSSVVYCLSFGISRMRGTSLAEAAIEAQCGVIGNTCFLGMPMLVVLLWPLAAGPVLMVLAIDLIVFSTLITIVITASREGRMTRAAYGRLLLGLVKNPMIVSMCLGLGWSLLAPPMPVVMSDFLTLLGGASTPGALFCHWRLTGRKIGRAFGRGGLDQLYKVILASCCSGNCCLLDFLCRCPFGRRDGLRRSPARGRKCLYTCPIFWRGSAARFSVYFGINGL